MTTKPDVRLSPGLHPDTVGHLLKAVPAAYRTGVAPDIESARAMVAGVYSDLSRLYDLRSKLSADPTRTEQNRTLEMSRAAESVFKRAAAQLDKRTDALRDEISALTAELAAPLQPKPGDALSGEIRGYLRSLPEAERMAAVNSAVDSGDAVTAIAALSAPAFLTGISDDLHRGLTEQWHRRQNPAAAARLELLVALRGRLMDHGGLLHGAVQKAVGADPRAVEGLRAR
ncbi:MAG: hypothetical protein IT469_03660, partial [Pseudomonadales bacterium]|nr:hypothetical protein [Pseudomonadales bacterium]